jgi:hypothetical protein
MPNLKDALQQLRQERSRAQAEVEKLDEAISVIESLNGSGVSRKGTRATRIVSAASRRKMAQAQKARWAKHRRESQSPTKTSLAPVKRTMSASARRKIAGAQRARWAKVKAQQKKTS